VDVYLVRHAIAELRDTTRWPDDSLRPLSAGPTNTPTVMLHMPALTRGDEEIE